MDATIATEQKQLFNPLINGVFSVDSKLTPGIIPQEWAWLAHHLGQLKLEQFAEAKRVLAEILLPEPVDPVELECFIS